MKKEIRRKLLFLIYELERKNIDGIDMTVALTEVFEMLHMLMDEKTFAIVTDMWKNRSEGADKDSMTIGLMKFDREVRFLLIEKKYI